jgi:hypothetical protein
MASPVSSYQDISFAVKQRSLAKSVGNLGFIDPTEYRSRRSLDAKDTAVEAARSVLQIATFV